MDTAFGGVGLEHLEFIAVVGTIGGGEDCKAASRLAVPRPLGLGHSRNSEPATGALAGGERGGSIEIELMRGVRLSVDAAVNEMALSQVLRAIKGRCDQSAARHQGVHFRTIHQRHHGTAPTILFRIAPMPIRFFLNGGMIEVC